MTDTALWGAATLLILAAAALCAPPSPFHRIRVATGHEPKQPRDHPAQASPLDVAADIELFAACTAAGLPTETVITAVAAAAGPTTVDAWRTAGALIAVGAPGADAWQVLTRVRGLDELARIALHSGESGATVSAGCERIARRLREDAADEAVGAAERAGVLIALPLTLCFLPAFILLGLVPIVISLGGQLLG
ncbi:MULTISPECIES: type II secretion system F family protein [unclassified Corynebacterium]|uniref:type II secretion system F family protein n=1 Tax=unclassified Corynebacterium TaxID=2624378 RepID=UPI003523C18D